MDTLYIYTKVQIFEDLREFKVVKVVITNSHELRPTGYVCFSTLSIFSSV